MTLVVPRGLRGMPRVGVTGVEMFGEGPALIPGREDGRGRSRVVVCTGCGGERVSLWEPEADGPGDLGVQPHGWGVGSEDERAEGAGQHPANRHQEAPLFCVMAAGFALRGSVWGELPGPLLGDRREPGAIE